MEAWLFILAGLALLILGGEALVRGASGIALLARLTPAVIGLTIVAAGTSMPEMVVSVKAALADSPGLAIGNVVGSNIFNIAFILGFTSLLLPLRILGNTVRLEWPVMALAALQLHLLSRDLQIDRFEGGFLLLAMLAFTSYAVMIGRKAATSTETAEFGDVATASFGRTGGPAWMLNSAAILAGIGLLAWGASLLVEGAVAIAAAFGISETIIGLTIVAGGTGAPELVTSLMAAWRGKDDIAVGNIIGSCIFNLLAIIGVTALIKPVPVPIEIIARDSWWMLGVTLILFPLMVRNMKIKRSEGAILLTIFLAYMVVLSRSL